MKVPVVVDTNVVVAGLISTEDTSPVCRILDGMLSGDFIFVLSRALLQEYRSVLLRETIRKLHGLSAGQIDLILTTIVANAVFRDPIDESATAPDRGDDHLWHLLQDVEGAVLATGDRKLLQNPPQLASVVSPRSFVDLLNNA